MGSKALMRSLVLRGIKERMAELRTELDAIDAVHKEIGEELGSTAMIKVAKRKKYIMTAAHKAKLAAGRRRALKASK